LYRPGDKKVKKGEYKVGDQCFATARAVEKTHGFCGGHFKKWNKENDPEANVASGKKRSATSQKKRQEVVEKNREIVENSNNTLNEKTKEILGVLGKNEKYDLIYEYSLMKSLNIDPQKEKYAEKFAFALWLNTPEAMRMPKTMEEAAEILGVVMVTLAMWRRSPEITRIINDKARESHCRSYPYIFEKLLEQVALGSERAMDIGLKHIKELEAEMAGNKSKLPNISEKLIEEARRSTEGTSSDRLTGVANIVKKVVIYDSMIAGNIKPNDTVQ